ncbi:MAG: alpha/beta hydrolase family protein [Alkalispirochaeta sp.]
MRLFSRCLTSIAMMVFFVFPATVGYAQSEGTVRSVTDEGTMTPGEVDQFAATLFSDARQPSAQYAVDIYEVQVYTRYPNGRLTPFRVQIFVPRRNRSVSGVYLFAPGSTGMIGPCRASREHVAGIRWGLYRAHVLAMAGQGFVGILPDYMGFEDDDLVQPYFHAASEARVVFDSLTAVDTWIAQQYPERFPDGIRDLRRVASGFSQGGHAALAAADRNISMGGDLYLHGVIGYGPTAQIEPMLQIYPSLGPMVAMSYLKVYGRGSFDPADVLQSRWAAELEYDMTRQCVGGIQGYYPSDPSELYRPEFLRSLRHDTLDKTHPVIDRIFSANLTGLARHNVPVLILQGTEDVVVSRSTQDEYVRMLEAQGTPVDYRVFDGARHDTRQVGFEDAIRWMENLNPAERPRQRSGPRRFDRDLDR